MASKKLENLSLEELEQENFKLQDEKEAIRSKQLAIAAEFDRRAAEEQLADLTDAQKAHLAQVISAQGIETTEQVNSDS